jgi:cell division protein FtsL
VGVAVVLGGAIIFAVLLEQVVLAQSAFELGTLRKNMATAESEHEALLLESAKLDNAARIERYARHSLGMVDPAPGSIQYVVADVRTGTPLAETTVRHGSAGLRAAGVSSMENASAVGADYEGSP